MALKVIKDEFSLQPEFTNMFLDEAKIVSRLSHPNIVHVEELGNEGKRLYLAMELLAGQSLWHLWSACRERGVRLRYETIAWIGARVASGLHHAHELSIDGIVQGLVHRDVNASNIIVGYDGTVKIIDFGLAKARGRISQTAAGVVKGKLAYMSPEQAVGKPLDRRTDVFALAATLWEVTTDRRLFKGTDDVDTLKRVYAAKIPDPTKLVEGYPAALWEVLKRGLKRHADERWPDALAFSVALDEVAKSGKGGDASTVAKVMGELFAEQRARQERWTAEASRQDGAAAMETLRPPRLDEGAESASSIVSAAPISVRPRPIASPSASASVSASLDSLFLLAADLMAIASRTEESTTPAGDSQEEKEATVSPLRKDSDRPTKNATAANASATAPVPPAKDAKSATRSSAEPAHAAAPAPLDGAGRSGGPRGCCSCSPPRPSRWWPRSSLTSREPGTEGGTRTLTPLRTADFESAASTIPPLRLACPPPTTSAESSRRRFCDWQLFLFLLWIDFDVQRCSPKKEHPPMSNLRMTLDHLASVFASSVLDAIRGASLQEILAESAGGGARRPGRPRLEATVATEASHAGAPSSPAGARRRRGRLARRSAGDISQIVDSIVSLLERRSDGLRAEQIRAELGLEAKELPRPIARRSPPSGSTSRGRSAPPPTSPAAPPARGQDQLGQQRRHRSRRQEGRRRQEARYRQEGGQDGEEVRPQVRRVERQQHRVCLNGPAAFPLQSSAGA